MTLFVQNGKKISHTPPQEIYQKAIDNLRANRAELSLEYCEKGLRQFPDDPNFMSLTGRVLIMLKRLDEARALVDKTLSLYPKFPAAHDTLADLFLVEGKAEQALKSYQTALELDPGRGDIRIKIKRATEVLNQTTSARSAQSAAQNQLPYAAELAQAAQFDQNKEPNKAENIYRDILRRDPEHVEAMRLLAGIAVSHRNLSEAETFLLQAVSRAPGYARAWLDLAAVQGERDKFQEAIESAKQVVELMPGVSESHVALANAAAKAGLAEDAIVEYERALELTPNHAGAFSGLGHQLKTVGRQAEAVKTHRMNIAANPNNTEPYWSLANMKTFRFEDDEVTAMQRLLDTSDLDDLGMVQLNNALGLEFENRENYPQAFEHFRRCNEKRRQLEVYDPVETEAQTDRLIEIFNEEFIAKNSGKGEQSAAPILIVGLPRSGSTLIEQILASHSQVEGTHELSDLSRVVRALRHSNPKKTPFPDVLTDLTANAWSKIGNHYLTRTSKYRSRQPRFIDKNPNNFTYAGLLHLALPNAKIINALRHPMDSCFGSYKQLFASGQPFSYDLTELGEYYIQYDRLLKHWHRVIPGSILNVQYEAVVEDLETQVRRLLKFCDLPFEESCLRFHETDRAVKTASSEQVRQPIYSSSINLWQNYAPHLEELHEILEPVLPEQG